MAGKLHSGDHDRCCNRVDDHCAALTVRRLSPERVRELAEEIWTASSGRAVLARPALDPRGSQPGASAQAAYRRHRQQRREAWRQGWWWRCSALATAAVGGGLLIGLTVGAWLGWPMALVAALATVWLPRPHRSSSAKAWQRRPRRARTLSWRPRAARSAPIPELRWQAAAVADILTGGSLISVRALLCIHGGAPHGGCRLVDGVQLATSRQLLGFIGQGSRPPPVEVERATASALELLRQAV
jgi:hypothetical protein